MENVKIAIVGLGYVGLPLAVEFGKIMPIIGFDINEKRINELKGGIDSGGEILLGELKKAIIDFTCDPIELKKANFIIVAVPTPIDGFKKPDLTAIRSSAEIVGKNLQIGSVVVYESTVYPGVTEDVCGPILEQYSGLRRSADFKLGYSPERINPGDKVHTIDKIIKIVSAEDPETLEKIAGVYNLICRSGVYKAASIKVAEAAKIIENIQRDLNIALINELSLIFHYLNVNTKDVIDAASTKWNFHKYYPGLVGGHCIGVDPYYLTSIIEQLGYHPELILTGRRINEYMADYIAELVIKGLISAGKTIQNAKILIMGLTFKENVKDIRNSKVNQVIKKLKEYKIDVYTYDPLLTEDEINVFDATNILNLNNSLLFDGIAICVMHEQFQKLSLSVIKNLISGRPVLVDVKGIFNDLARLDKDLVYYCL